jgi:protein phosphatase 1K
VHTRESERQRIERQNPNPKMPMVRYVGGTWRVGGLLALSRAFGDSYLKVCLVGLVCAVLGSGLAPACCAPAPQTPTPANAHTCHTTHAHRKTQQQGSLQFEGVSIDRANSYSSGFGVVSTPHTTLTPLTPGDSFLVLASDGLFNEEARGGGGGLDEDGVAELCRAALKAGGSSESLARTLAETAVAVGSTDDVTVVVMRLGV